jgi:3D (Asp-Asp-Asp) domain-containing protein
VRGSMSPLLFRSGALALVALTLGACSSTKPLPKFERPLPHSQHQTVRTTAYTHTESDHIRYGRKSALGGGLRSEGIRSAAADWARWPAGTIFRIQETGEMYEVDDYGWALAGTNTIDLYKPTRASMNSWGVRRVHIEIQRWGDQRRSLSVLSGRTKYAHVRRMVSEIRSDRQPFAPLSAPTVTPALDTIPETMMAQTAPPRAELASAQRGPAPATPRAELVSVLKPFRP